MATKGQENRRYVFVSVTDMEALDMSCFFQGNTATPKRNLANDETLISYEDGSVPDCLTGVTLITKDGRTEHTEDEAKDIIFNLEDNLWNDPNPII